MAKVLLLSRCSWTLYVQRRGQITSLLADKHEVVGAGAGGDGFESRVEALGIPFRPVPVNKRTVNPAADVRLVAALYRLLKRERPDVVHNFTIKPVISGSIAAHMAGVPRIVNTVCGLGYVFTDGANPFIRAVVERLYAFALARAHHTFFENSDDRNLFIERRMVAAERSSLLKGSGIDLEHYAPPPAAFEKEPVTFLFCARLLIDKGVGHFVEAARMVKARAPEARFWIMGGRDERNPRCIPQAELDRWQADGVVEYLGEKSDVREYMGNADVVVLPSYYREGTPHVLLEAAAMERALITTDHVGCREAVDDGVTGLLVPICDPAALAAAMQRMIDHPAERRSMGVAGRQKMVREFDETLVNATIKAAYAL